MIAKPAGGNAAFASPEPTHLSRRRQDFQAGQSPKMTPMVRHKVMWRRNWKSQEICAWWDSSDGKQGGRKLRVHVLDDQLHLVRRLDLFPAGPYLFTVTTRSGRTVELPYATFTYCSADSEGPPSFIFVAPGGITYPHDADYALPSLEKQLEFKQVESERIAAMVDRQRMDAMEAEVVAAEQVREQVHRTDEQSVRLGRMLERARIALPPEAAEDEEEEPDGAYAMWTQLRPSGTLPPAHKHPITLLRHFDKVVTAPLPEEQPQFPGSSKKRVLDYEDEMGKVTVRISTLEVWMRDFTRRYNLYLKVENIANGQPVDAKWCGLRLMTWVETHVFDPEVAPTPRDSPSMISHGQKMLLFGGKTLGAYKSYFGDLWSFNYEKNRWMMFEDEERGARGAREKPGLSGKKPTPRSSAVLQTRRHNLIIAGGSDRSGKRQDVLLLDLNSLEFHEFVANVSKSGDVLMSGELPPRGFCMRNVRTKNQIYAPLLSDQKIYELCLHTNNWSSIQTEGFLPWQTSRLLSTEDGPMTRFTALDCSSLDAGYPAVESARVWRVYSNLNPMDIRMNPPREWQLQQGQVATFEALPSRGDAPGNWAAQSISVGHLDRDPQTGRLRTVYYIFGGAREGGVQCLSKIPTRRELVVGKDVPACIGMRVRRRGTAQPAMSNLRQTSTGNRAMSASSRQSHTPSQEEVRGIVVQLGAKEEHEGSEWMNHLADPVEDQLACMVLWDGQEEPQRCKTGQGKEYELKQAVNYEQYYTHEHITNEVFTFEVVEGVEHDNILNELYEIRKDQGFTDASSLKSVLGDDIKIIWNEKRRRRRRQSTV